MRKLIFIFIAGLILNSETIIVIKSGNYPEFQEAIDGFWDVLSKNGYDKKSSVEFVIEKDNLNKIISEVRNRKPKLILTIGNTATKSFINENIPIVFSMVLDPVRYKIIDNLDHPKENITGVVLDVPVKLQFEAMKQTIQGLKKLGIIHSSELSEFVSSARDIANDMKLELITQVVREENDVIPAFQKLVEAKIDLLWMIPDPITLKGQNKQKLLEYAKKLLLPVYGPTVSYLKGDLSATFTLNPDYKSLGVQTGKLALKILNSEKDIPIEFPSKFVLFVKNKTLKKIPPNAVIID